MSIGSVLSKITEIESGNNESLFRVRALKLQISSLEKNLDEAKQLQKDCEEEISQLKEQIGSLEVECASEDQSCERVRAKIADLRNRETERGKLLDAGKNEVSKQKTVLLQNLHDNNALLRSLIASTRETLRLTNILQTSEEYDSASAAPVATTDEEDETTLRAELEQLQARDTAASSKLELSLEETKKLGQIFTDTIKEYEVLDEASNDLQTQLTEIQEWYATLEEWNKDGKCPSCAFPIDVCATVDARLKESNDAEANADAINPVPSAQIDD